MHTLPAKYQLNDLTQSFSKQLGNFTALRPEWYSIEELPGFSNALIRNIGADLFKLFTSTPLPKIQVLSTLSGNTRRELSLISAFIDSQCVRKRQAEILFDEVFPGYVAEIAIYSVDKIEFMVVRDDHGHYIYAYEQLSKLEDNGQKRLQHEGN